MESNNKLYWIYRAGLFIILALPILALPPYFSPPNWGKTIVFRSIVAILLFLFVYQVLYKKSQLSFLNLKKNYVFGFLAILFFLYLLASVFSVDPSFSFWGSPSRGDGFVTYALYFVFALMVSIIYKKEDWEKLWDFSVLVGVLVALGGIIQYYGLFNKIFFAVTDRPPSTLGNSIFLGMYLLIVFFICLALLVNGSFNSPKNKTKKVLYAASLLIIFYTILITGSRAAYLGLVAGVIYFLLFYPRKNKFLKTGVLILLIAVAASVLYINTAQRFPGFLEQNKLFKSFEQRLLVGRILNDPRFSAWSQVDLKILASKPMLGYGPENFSVGFDKYYNPSADLLDIAQGDWWDRAHNILIQTASDAGLLAALVYLGLFAALLWQLQKVKKQNKIEQGDKNTLLMAHGIQAALIAYFIDNLFNIDSFPTWLLFFLIIAYCLHFTSENREQSRSEQKNAWWKPALMFVLFVALVIFLWQYNLVPLQINAEINVADSLVQNKNCDQAFSLMEKTLQNHSFLDAYARIEYIEFSIPCDIAYPQNDVTYIQNGLKYVQEAVKIQPLYTRFWISMASYVDDLASQQSDTQQKQTLIKQGSDYLDQAAKLSPKRQEIIVEQARAEMIVGNYQKMLDYAKKCNALNPTVGNCYFYSGLAKIYLKDSIGADADIKSAKRFGYAVDSILSLKELANAYMSMLDYKNLVVIFPKLIALEPNVVQYHSSLAYAYKELGDYADARKEALIVLQLSPQSKPNVDAFLQSLP